MLVLINLVVRLLWSLSFGTFISAMRQTVCIASVGSIRPDPGSPRG